MNIINKTEEPSNEQKDNLLTETESNAGDWRNDNAVSSAAMPEAAVGPAVVSVDAVSSAAMPEAAVVNTRANPLGVSVDSAVGDTIYGTDKTRVIAVNAFDDINDEIERDDGENLGYSDDTLGPKDKRRTSIITFLRDIAISFGIALLIVQFINPTVVKGQSMEPTLHDSNYIFLSKKQYTFSEIHHGQIIVFKPNEAFDPSNKDNLLIKRVIALSGDELIIKGGNVFLNGEIIYESYLMEQYTAGYLESLVIPDGYVFVMGDNRQHSLDSRSSNVGLVSEKQIIGMAFFRVFPLDQFGLLS